MVINRSVKGLVAAGLLFGVGAVQAALQPYTSDGKNLVYSTEQNLTWTADANLFKTQCDAEGASNCPTLIAAIIAAGSPVTHTSTIIYPSPHEVQPSEFHQDSGLMTWFAAKAWVTYLNSITYGGATNWRLWEADPSDTNCSLQNTDPGVGFPTQYYGYGCIGNELGYLYYEEGGAMPRDSGGPPISTLTPLSVFSNLKDLAYWSATEYAPGPLVAWLLDTNGGFQGLGSKTAFPYYSWAVRAGQVGPPTPEATPIPTLSEWAKILLALSLMGMAGWHWQRRPS